MNDKNKKQRDIPEGYILCPLCSGFGCTACDIGLVKKSRLGKKRDENKKEDGDEE